MRTPLCASVCILAASVVSFGQSDTQTFKISSSIAPLSQPVLGPAGDFKKPKEPYKSGVLSEETFRTTVLPALQASAAHAYNNDVSHGADPNSLTPLTIDPNLTTIIHLMRWKDTAHTTIAFEKWYLYDPQASHTSFYVQTEAQIFQRTVVPGETHFQVLYIHINSDLSDATEGLTAGAAGQTLANPVTYTVTVTKAKTQLEQDLRSLVTLLGWTTGAGAAAANTNKDDSNSIYGYWSASAFDSAYTTSQIVVSASLNSKNQKGSPTTNPATGKSTPTTTTGQLSSKTYSNEKPSYFELGFAIPVTSYKEVTYSTTSSTVTPNTATKQTAVLVGNLYLPPAQPGLTTFRYIPHLLYGLPIKGKVLQHTMLGAGIGLDWLSPYAGIIFDTNYGATTGANAKSGHLVLKGTFGIEISVSSAASLLKGK